MASIINFGVRGDVDKKRFNAETLSEHYSTTKFIRRK